MTDKEKLDAILAEDAANNNEQPQEEQPKNEASQYLGTSLTHNPAYLSPAPYFNIFFSMYVCRE